MYKSIKRTVLIFSALFVLALLRPGSAAAQDGELVIVGHAASVPEALDKKLLLSVLKGEKLRWNDGQPLTIALMKTNTSIGSNTCENLYNMTANQLQKHFLALVFQGKIKPPTFFNAASDLEDYIAHTPGAIGVLDKKTLDGIKVILVDGKDKI